MAIAGHYQGRQRRQRGAAAVEFALVAVLLIVLLLGIVELGRFLYLYDTVQEVTRRAAREAVVSCTDQTTRNGIQSRAVLGNGSVGVSLPAGGEITDASVVIDYLDQNQVSINNPPLCGDANIVECAANAADCIRFVRVRVCNYQNNNQCNPIKYEPMIGLFSPDPSNPLTGMQRINLGVPIPGSTVTMPAESLGFQM